MLDMGLRGHVVPRMLRLPPAAYSRHLLAAVGMMISAGGDDDDFCWRLERLASPDGVCLRPWLRQPAALSRPIGPRWDISTALELYAFEVTGRLTAFGPCCGGKVR